eukprot:CAMPEP_0119101604 /NCGR_PEP_ID=MMETSP1180-20130426/618_1 /TAXON_ID=3052 ORGANISM="Chlamydomonas cf sp, Strain CCMP681" /NCGR_SAMPLE_ID=MMETSP1180 /ASSEMBLY_ACC=CAM_ASM_000741 /LENGTH=337 /DNA_ID=CAMNT_0007085751 /DNA_START=18 /DNA_END=1031 /DNA_ORIENTATION=-
MAQAQEEIEAGALSGEPLPGSSPPGHTRPSPRRRKPLVGALRLEQKSNETTGLSGLSDPDCALDSISAPPAPEGKHLRQPQEYSTHGELRPSSGLNPPRGHIPSAATQQERSDLDIARPLPARPSSPDRPWVAHMRRYPTLPLPIDLLIEAQADPEAHRFAYVGMPPELEAELREQADNFRPGRLSLLASLAFAMADLGLQITVNLICAAFQPVNTTKWVVGSVWNSLPSLYGTPAATAPLRLTAAASGPTSVTGSGPASQSMHSPAGAATGYAAAVKATVSPNARPSIATHPPLPRPLAPRAEHLAEFEADELVLARYFASAEGEGQYDQDRWGPE